MNLVTKRADPQWAHSMLESKAAPAADGKKRRFSGVASTPTLDRGQDIVVPTGAVIRTPLPLLMGHDHDRPIGWITSYKATSSGITVEGEVAQIDTPGELKDCLDKAWQQIELGLVRGLSIGFRSLESEQIEGTWGTKFLKYEIYEISACVVPMNADCSIQTIKSIDNQARAAFGNKRKGVVRLDPTPGVPGTPTKPSTGGLSSVSPKGTTVKTIAERKAEFAAKKAENLSKITELVNKSLEEGTTLNAEQKALREQLTAEIAEIDDHVKMLDEHEQLMVKSATAVTPGNTPTVAAGVEVRSGAVITVKSNVEKGIGLARIAMAIGHSKGNLTQATQIAKNRWKETPQVAAVLEAMSMHGSTEFTKAAVAVGDSNTSGWASQLVYYSDMASEFIELLRPKTILGKIQGLRRVPFNIRFGSSLTGTSSAWVGENNPIPASAMAFSSGTLGHAKAASLVVITKELAAFSNPAAEALVRDDMMGAMQNFLDAQFIDPTVAASANVSPASVTNGLTPVASSGSTVAAIYNDVQAVLQSFAENELDISDGVWVMRPSTALALMMKRTTQDVAIFPGISQTGGTWFGLPVVTSNSVPGSISGGSIIALVKPSEVFYADDGGITLDYSEEASVQMLTNPATGAQAQVSLFQNGLVALRAVREINWQRRRAASVAYISGVTY